MTTRNPVVNCDRVDYEEDEVGSWLGLSLAAEDLEEHDEEDRDVAEECGSGPVVTESRHKSEHEDGVSGGSRKFVAARQMKSKVFQNNIFFSRMISLMNIRTLGIFIK